jgi:hypothetical protein
MNLEGSCLCGAVTWTFDGPLASVTACNCTACRRYGTLWAYGYEGHEIKTAGDAPGYFRKPEAPLGFHFCKSCACVAFWRGTAANAEGKRRIAVNVRLANDPEQVQGLLVDHFDGLGEFEDLPSDGKCVRDLWF